MFVGYDIKTESHCRLKTLDELMKDDYELEQNAQPKSHKVNSQPNFLNESQESKEPFSLKKALKTNTEAIKSFEVREPLDYMVKTKLLLERVDLLKLQDLIKEIKELKRRTRIYNEIQDSFKALNLPKNRVSTTMRVELSKLHKKRVD